MPKSKKPKLAATVASVAIDALSVEAGAVSIQVTTALPAADPFYSLVGRVASEWAHLEHMLDIIIYQITNSRVRESFLPANVLACITSQIMGVGPRCKVIILLAEVAGLSEKDVRKPARALMGKSYKVADLRARFVHDPWYTELGTNRTMQFRAMPYSDPAYGYT